ncbi:MAG: trehalose-phosphatase [Mycobacteriaceae bacterium]
MDLSTELRHALGAIAGTPQLLVTSDYDGTLAPIVNDPGAAYPHPDAVDLLIDLAALPHTSTALISGRARADLALLSSAPPQVHLVGSHGSEFDKGFVRPLDDSARALHGRLHTELRAVVEGLVGVALEVKPASIAVHVRNAAVEVGTQALAAVRGGPAQWDGVEVTEGKAVIELAVIATDKGDAIEALRQRVNATAVVFFGDDVTDEKAFRRLGPDDLGVKVGPGDTAATYRVDSTEDVVTALRFLLEQRRLR